MQKWKWFVTDVDLQALQIKICYIVGDLSGISFAVWMKHIHAHDTICFIDMFIWWWYGIKFYDFACDDERSICIEWKHFIL